MKSKIFKILIPILVLALLLQVPFAVMGTAADLNALAASTNFTFEVSKAPEGEAGDVQIDLYVTGTGGEKLSTIGATIVVNVGENGFDLVDEDGNVVTDTYRVGSAAIPLDFAIDYCDLIGANAGSLASYNAANEEMYLFLAGYLADESNPADVKPGLVVPADTKLATLYLKTKEGASASAANIRVMAVEEFRNTCPGGGVYPAGFGSVTDTKFYIAQSEDGGVMKTNAVCNFNFAGAIQVTNIASTDKALLPADTVATLMLGEQTVATAVVESGSVEFTDVPAGTYDIVISAPSSLGYRIKNISVTVNETYTVSSAINLIFGDSISDGIIDIDDLGNLLENYDSSNSALTDINGDGITDIVDLGLILDGDHYDVSSTRQVLDLAE